MGACSEMNYILTICRMAEQINNARLQRKGLRWYVRKEKQKLQWEINYAYAVFD